MKIFLAQQNYHIGNFSANVEKICSAIRTAKQGGGDLIVFSELAVCGYPPRDFLEFDDFIGQCLAAIDTIKAEADTIGVIIGAPSRNTSGKGKGLYNSAYLLYEREIKAVVHKTLLPTYDIFDEYRYFEPADTWNTVSFQGKKIALTICEDMWNVGDAPLYRIRPLDILAKERPDFIVNISASPFDYLEPGARIDVIRQNVQSYGIPLVYVNAVGSQTEVVFDGGSLVMNADGTHASVLPYFEESIFPVVVDGNKVQNTLPLSVEHYMLPSVFDAKYGIDKIHTALILGIRDYFSKMGITKAFVASSGGIDSALTLTLATEALGSSSVEAILMPSSFSSSGSVTDAEQLAKNLGITHHVLPIHDVFSAYQKTLHPVFHDLPFNVAEENLQSRIRGTLIMALTNKFGGILLNTSNKSELATGYGTLYGDMAGGLSVLGDLYKTQVYALAEYCNRKHMFIPESVVTKAPSAELHPDQKDSDTLPPYPVLDPILYQYIERRKGPQEIIALGNDTTLVHRILSLVNTNEYKRNQFCPIIRVSQKAFGMGRRMPIVGTYLS